MASFFPSFTSSSMPKRLLRYALSRLELLDANALNLDNLDLALGKNTVLEFRDVGVKLDVRIFQKLYYAALTNAAAETPEAAQSSTRIYTPQVQSSAASSYNTHGLL